ncbi:hypothetical protein ElyMa_005421600 [Elysia marginata]|uniref:Uncharacterized protein n=1 Tax=Elysia marginata TaxID=1093978 RepID=A0AAV4EJ80_9GAST|nr:hypothetical protein ElyMa_005421600 [Elysia marginata]
MYARAKKLRRSRWAGRFDFEFAKVKVAHPSSTDPKTKMNLVLRNQIVNYIDLISLKINECNGGYRDSDGGESNNSNAYSVDGDDDGDDDDDDDYYYYDDDGNDNDDDGDDDDDDENDSNHNNQYHKDEND